MRLSCSLPLLLGAIFFCSPLPGAETLREAAGKRLLVGCAVATVDLICSYWEDSAIPP